MIYIAYMGFFLYLCRMKYFIIERLRLVEVTLIQVIDI